MGGGKAPKEYLAIIRERDNKKLLEEPNLERDILRELKKDEIADDKWLDNYRLEAIRLTIKKCSLTKLNENGDKNDISTRSC